MSENHEILKKKLKILDFLKMRFLRFFGLLENEKKSNHQKCENLIDFDQNFAISCPQAGKISHKSDIHIPFLDLPISSVIPRSVKSTSYALNPGTALTTPSFPQ